MAKFILSLILILTFVTATAAELNCDCNSESPIHQDVEKNQNSGEEQDHCQHTCTQCHMTFVVPSSFELTQVSTISYLTFPDLVQTTVDIPRVLFRPPIS